MPERHSFLNPYSCVIKFSQSIILSLSLLRFSLFANELTLDETNNGRHGVSLSTDFVQLVILLFADDMILLSETVIGLQTRLNSLFSAASRLQLKYG